MVQLLNDIAEWSPSVSKSDFPREAVSVESLMEILEFMSSPSSNEVKVLIMIISAFF